MSFHLSIFFYSLKVKKQALCLAVILLFGFFFSTAQTTIIPDANFEDYLETHDQNGIVVSLGDAASMGDGIANNQNVFTDRITDLLSLNIGDLGIEDLTGIADFTSLEILVCSNNKLFGIDVSNNTNLTLLNVSNNRISGELIVSNNLSLESLFCASNQISKLNLSANTVLKNLDASNNVLTSLDLSNINTQVCPNPQTDPLTLCQGSSSVNVSRNELTSLIVNNGYNDLITSFDSTENPDLFCIQIDTGFAPMGWNKDDWTYYSDTTCADIYTYVPDDNFEQALIDRGYDTTIDNLVLTSNIIAVTNLDVSNLNINSLLGIEDFEALQTLNCSVNNIQDIDLSSNISLASLNASTINLTNLDLSNNPDLNLLDISNNQLSNLNLSSNLIITNLNCSSNNIQSLNLSNHTALTDFNCDSNALQVLNLKNGQNTNLANFSAINNPDLSCIETDTGAMPGGVTWIIDATASYNTNCGTYVPDDNFEQALIDSGLDTGPLNNYVPTGNIVAVTNLDVSGYNIADLTGIEDFSALAIFNCSNNAIVELNLTTNTALTSLTCNNNALEFLDIRNGNNTNLSTFNASNNTILYCINVDTAVIGSIPGGWVKDAIASYNDDCENNRYTPIPDNNFEQALVDLGIDSGALDNQVLTANIEYLTSLNVNSKNIESLEGIKAFLSLTELDCGDNYLNELDVSNMVNLQSLYCGSNYFLTNNPANTNGLLNTSGTINLIKLFCADNKLDDLNIASNINLEELDCSNNNLSVLDISNNSNLVGLNCNSNQITNLATSAVNNNSLLRMSCSNNGLNILNVTNYLALTTLYCRSNALTQLDITSNVALEVLDFSDNDLSNINLSGKTNLISVSGSQNQLTDVNDLASAVLESLIIENNQIAQLNILNSFPELKYLSVGYNQLTALNASTNNNLIELTVSNNQITNLQLPSDLNQLKTFNCSFNQITEDLDLTTMGTGACPAPNPNNPQDFCPGAITINVSNNQLEFVNIQNGMNGEISNFVATNNPNLTCVQVDDVNNIGANWSKDATAEYNVDCRFGETYVPDDNFEQALINLGYDAGTLDDYVLTATIEILTNLDVSGYAISDLTGIQDFTALQILDFSNNAIDVVDLTQNINLTDINCSNNALTTLDLNNNINLVNLNIANNQFTEFDTSIIPTLSIFNCDANQIVDLDFQLNGMLTNLSCQSNLLESLNLKNGQNLSLANLNAQNNPNLNCIETDTGAVPGGVTWLKDAPASYSIDCHYGETYVPDDNFEQALIDLGYDSSVLDNYVVTSNISNIQSLNVGNQNIADPTGIEDFLGLTILNFAGNTITNIDLSSNILLQNLNVSGNGLTVLDVLANINLLALNVSNNSLAEIDLSSNLNLMNLNVSANLITTLNVDALVSLQTLNCSENQLDALSVVSNINLMALYCQSNLFVSDQLNIQNGNNENLKNFNATGNPLLSCILVDDPIAVITNANGEYDGWFKDTTANYQTICDDADNDGVANADDQCPNTPFGDTVDLFGCTVLDIPNNNFTVQITSETCLNNNDGKINISTLEYYNYTANLTKENFSKTYHFTNEIDILNLLAGTYQLCITMEEWPDFEQCCTVVISQPDPLEVISSRSTDGGKVSLDMYGSTSFNIKFNEFEFTTNDATLTLNLRQGVNTLKISTDIDCQGVYEESLFFSDDAQVYPNPFQNKVDVYLGSAKEEVKVNVFSYLGQMVYSYKILDENTRNIQIDTSQWAEGFYSVAVETGSSLRTFKIVKK